MPYTLADIQRIYPKATLENQQRIHGEHVRTTEAHFEDLRKNEHPAETTDDGGIHHWEYPWPNFRRCTDAECTTPHEWFHACAMTWRSYPDGDHMFHVDRQAYHLTASDLKRLKNVGRTKPTPFCSVFADPTKVVHRKHKKRTWRRLWL